MMRTKRLIHTGLQWWISLFVWRFDSGEMGNVMGIRSFTLQALAFLRGGRRASSFLRGLAALFRWSQTPSASIHSVIFYLSSVFSKGDSLTAPLFKMEDLIPLGIIT